MNQKILVHYKDVCREKKHFFAVNLQTFSDLIISSMV